MRSSLDKCISRVVSGREEYQIDAVTTERDEQSGLYLYCEGHPAVSGP